MSRDTKWRELWSWCSVRDVESAIVFALEKVIRGSTA